MRAVFPTGLAIALICLLSQAKAETDVRKHPTGGKTPVEIAVGMYLTDLVAIDETRENFEVGGYLAAQWIDPRLATSDAKDTNALRDFQEADIWLPGIEAANSISHKRNNYTIQVNRDGLVTYTERFNATLSNTYDLRRFPFDTQELEFEFQPFLSEASGIEFAKGALPFTGISPDQHLELASWRIESLQYRLERVAHDRIAPNSSQALFQIEIKRRSGFYIWKVFLPLILMTLIPTVAFWIDPKEFDWLLKVPLTMLLSLVAFQFAIARDLPKVGYVTFLDATFLLSFVLFFVAIVEITLVYLLQKGGKRSAAVKMHFAGRWAYPTVYFLGFLGLAIDFLS
jgi:hypothetical protein